MSQPQPINQANDHGGNRMTNFKTTPKPPRQIGRRATTALLLAAATLATLSIVASAGGSTTHRVKLDSTMFAAQVGSIDTGGSVFAGALPDPSLGHGAIVFTTTGTTNLHMTFQEFFALGTIKGTGSATLTPQQGGQEKVSGSLKITGGTAKYHNATGNIVAAGNINKAGMVKATLKGSFTH
jgi:hypothetical protein